MYVCACTNVRVCFSVCVCTSASVRICVRASVLAVFNNVHMRTYRCTSVDANECIHYSVCAYMCVYV